MAWSDTRNTCSTTAMPSRFPAVRSCVGDMTGRVGNCLPCRNASTTAHACVWTRSKARQGAAGLRDQCTARGRSPIDPAPPCRPGRFQIPSPGHCARRQSTRAARALHSGGVRPAARRHGACAEQTRPRVDAVRNIPRRRSGRGCASASAGISRVVIACTPLRAACSTTAGAATGRPRCPAAGFNGPAARVRPARAASCVRASRLPRHGPWLR